MKYFAYPLVFAAAVIAAPLSAEMLGEDAQACKAGRGPAIQVNISDLKDRKGEIWLELYPATEADFLRPDTDLWKEGKTFRRTRGWVPKTGDTSICVKVPHPGRYALLLRHSRTGKDRFSVWSDGAGVPANKSLGRKKPTLAAASIEAGPGVTVANIKMQYLHGFGFSAQ